MGASRVFTIGTLVENEIKESRNSSNKESTLDKYTYDEIITNNVKNRIRIVKTFSLYVLKDYIFYPNYYK